MRTEKPVVITLPKANKLNGNDSLFNADDLEVFFQLALDNDLKSLQWILHKAYVTVSVWVSGLYEKTGCSFHCGLVTFAFKYGIVRFENDVLVRGWVILENGEYSIVRV